MVAAKDPNHLTRMQRQAALERLKDPEGSELQVLQRAGYTAGVAKNPRSNGILTDKLVEKLVRSEGREVTPEMARRASLGKLKGFLEDDEVPYQVQGSAAKILLDYSVNAPLQETDVDWWSERNDLRDAIQRVIFYCLQAARDRPERALDILRRLEKKFVKQG